MNETADTLIERWTGKDARRLDDYGSPYLFSLLRRAWQEKDRHPGRTDWTNGGPPELNSYMDATIRIKNALRQAIIREYLYAIQHSEQEKYLQAVARRRQEVHDQRMARLRSFFGRKP